MATQEYFVRDNSKWLKYIKSFDRTWTAAEGPKKDAYNIGKLFSRLMLYGSFIMTSLEVNDP